MIQGKMVPNFIETVNNETQKKAMQQQATSYQQVNSSWKGSNKTQLNPNSAHVVRNRLKVTGKTYFFF
jgi:hypothetical protein